MSPATISTTSKSNELLTHMHHNEETKEEFSLNSNPIPTSNKVSTQEMMILNWIVEKIGCFYNVSWRLILAKWSWIWHGIQLCLLYVALLPIVVVIHDLHDKTHATIQLSNSQTYLYRYNTSIYSIKMKRVLRWSTNTLI